MTAVLLGLLPAVVMFAAGLLLRRHLTRSWRENAEWVGDDLETRKQAARAADQGAHHWHAPPEPPVFMRTADPIVWRPPT